MGQKVLFVIFQAVWRVFSYSCVEDKEHTLYYVLWSVQLIGLRGPIGVSQGVEVGWMLLCLNFPIVKQRCWEISQVAVGVGDGCYLPFLHGMNVLSQLKLKKKKTSWDSPLKQLNIIILYNPALNYVKYYDVIFENRYIIIIFVSKGLPITGKCYKLL